MLRHVSSRRIGRALKRLAPVLLLGLTAALPAAAQTAAEAAPTESGVTVSHALPQFGEPRLGPDFRHFPYADPEAPKGGAVTLAAAGSFDSLNTIPLQGETARSIGLIYDSLMVEPQDELAVYYPLIAESVEYPEDASWIVFNLRPEARFHDGTPITAHDVAWTFETIREHGRPFLRAFYEDVLAVEVLGERRVRFDFRTRDTRQPLVRVAGLTVLPRHWWTAEGRDITRSTLEPPLGSGPYRLVAVDQGRGLTYERVEDYWAADLPVRRGQFNFDRVRYDYYRDADIMFEAFKAGAYDFRRETTSRLWATGYDLAAVRDGHMIRDEIDVTMFRGIQGYFLNTRRPPFDDIRVRQALGYLYPFEWVNRNVMYGLYQRIESYFPGAEDYSAAGTLPDARELALLEPYRGQVPEAVFTTVWQAPETEGGFDRTNRRTALGLLREAGWEIRGGRLVNADTGEPMTFEILLSSPALEAHTQPFVRELERLGISASIRWVDSAQYQRRYQDRDFDVISFAYTFYPPPGGELMSYFGSSQADVPGSANVMGIRDPVADAMIDIVINAEDLETKQAATRALDRVLLWGFHAIPHWYNTVAWIAYWDKFGMPATHPPYDFGFANSIGFQPTWWVDTARAEALARAR